MPAPRLTVAVMLRYALQGAVLAVLAGVALVLLGARPETWEHLGDFAWGWTPVLFGLVALAWGCNAGRTWLWMKALGHRLTFRQSLAIVLSTEFGVAASPGGVGGMVVRVALLRRAGLPMPEAVSMTTAEVIADLLFFAALVPVALGVWALDPLWQRLSEQARPGTLTVVGASLGALAVAAYVLVRLRLPQRALEGLLKVVPAACAGRWPARWRRLRWAGVRGARQVLGTLAFLWRERRVTLLAVTGLAACQWLGRYGVLPVVLLGFGAEVNPVPLLVLQGFLFALGMMVVLPGGGGSVELLTALLLPLFVPGPVVPLAVLCWRFYTYYLYLVVGGLTFLGVTRAWKPGQEIGAGGTRAPF